MMGFAVSFGASCTPQTKFENNDHCCIRLAFCADCCDGSDEQQGCKNTCQAAGAAARQDLVPRSKDYAAGAKVRQKYVAQFAASKQTWQRDLDRVSKEIGPQQTLTDKVRGTMHCQSI